MSGPAPRAFAVGSTAEWGLTLEPAALDASGVPGDDVPLGALVALATGLLARGFGDAPLRVESLAADLVGRLQRGDTVWAHATVGAIDDATGLATLDLRWTNQRGEGVARGTAVVLAGRRA